MVEIILTILLIILLFSLVLGTVIGASGVFFGLRAAIRAFWRCTANEEEDRRFGWRLRSLLTMPGLIVEDIADGFEWLSDSWIDDLKYADGLLQFPKKVVAYTNSFFFHVTSVLAGVLFGIVFIVLRGVVFMFELIIAAFMLFFYLLAGWIGVNIGWIVGVAVGTFLPFKNMVSVIGLWIDFKEKVKDDAPEPARRNYFMGVGWRQLKEVFEFSFYDLGKLREGVVDVTDDLRDDDGLWGWFKKCGAITAKILIHLIMYPLNLLLTLAFAVVFAVVLVLGFLIVGPITGIAWVIERLYLSTNKVSADCPRCFSRYQLPYFRCPTCGKLHKRLLPGPYGILKHRCACGTKLPATFAGGRSKLESVCPNCGRGMVSTDAHPVTFQLVGGRSVGKTAFLAAFVQQATALLTAGGRTVSCPDEYRYRIKEMERIVTGENACSPTTHQNAVVYPLTVESEHGIPLQLSMYDVAGSLFNGGEDMSSIQQQHFDYCNGFLFFVDPLGSATLRKKRIANGRNFSRFSNDAPENVAAVFISQLQRIRHTKATGRFNTPLSVIIGKADLEEVRDAVGDDAVQQAMAEDPQTYPTYDVARDDLCRRFLMEHDMSATVQELELQFTTVHYFPVSATGGVRSGEPFRPWNVTEPVRWMLASVDKDLAALLNTQKEA